MAKTPNLNSKVFKLVFITYSKANVKTIFKLLETHETRYLIIVHQKAFDIDEKHMTSGLWIIVQNDTNHKFLKQCVKLDKIDGMTVQSWDYAYTIDDQNQTHISTTIQPDNGKSTFLRNFANKVPEILTSAANIVSLLRP